MSSVRYTGVDERSFGTITEYNTLIIHHNKGYVSTLNYHILRQPQAKDMQPLYGQFVIYFLKKCINRADMLIPYLYHLRFFADPFSVPVAFCATFVSVPGGAANGLLATFSSTGSSSPPCPNSLTLE